MSDRVGIALLVINRLVIALVATLLATAIPSPARSQAPPSGGPDSVTVIPGERYSAGAIRSMLLGHDHRDLWTTPLRVEVLDLGTFEGGLTPVRRGGGLQTQALRFRAPDGREFQFRSVDKDPAAVVPPELRETLVAEVIQDQISSAHPVGALAVSPILDAVGVLHAEPRLVVLPDDSRLGEFRGEFAGMLGIIEERPDESDSELASFAGASNVVGTDRLLERIEEDLELVDSRAFLAARLMDVFLGDFDRHEDQWRWARFGDRREDSWKPIPRDRDQAFVRMDGLLLSLARGFYPQFVKFEGDYGRVLGLAWQARRLDRRLLSELKWPTWDSVATALREQITDSVLDAAVERLPDEYAPSDTPVLRRRLASRRDQLRDGARSMYDLSAGEVDIYTTDASEVAHVERLPDGDLQVVVTAPETPAGPLEIFRRRFHRTETKEIRLFLRGGADSVRVVGERRGIGVRVVGGGGRDRFVDEAGGAHFYDVGDNGVFVRGPGTSVDHRDFEIPPRTASPFNRDWGRRYSFPPRIRFSPDIGLLFGATVQRHDFGFRKLPWSSVTSLTAGWATGADALFVQGRVQVYRENSPTYWLVDGHASGLEVLRYHGLGNETIADRPKADYRTDTREYALEPRLVLPFGSAVSLALGPSLKFTETRRPPAWLDGEPLPYGMADFGRVGFATELALDGTDSPRAPSSGAFLSLGGSVFPAVWDVEDPFGRIEAVATTYWSPAGPLAPTLAVRAGATKMVGTYPYFDAAHIGDDETVRLGRDRRFAGDAIVYGNAELRVRIARPVIVLPVGIGLIGLYDVGRVWYEGESSDRWHGAYGGGLWIAFLRPENAVTVTVSRGEEHTGVYLSVGFPF